MLEKENMWIPKNALTTLGCLILACTSLYAQPGITIASPQSGTVIHPGQSITIRLSLTTGMRPKSMGIASPELQTLIPVPETSPSEISFSFPEDVVSGTFTFTAFGTTLNNVELESNNLQFLIERADKPISITVEPSMIHDLAVGDHYPLHVSASFSTGTETDITHSTRTTYSTKNPEIAIVRQGVLSALKPGHTEITVANSGITAPVVPVSVLNYVSIAPATAKLYGSMTEQFQVYPSVKKLGPFRWSVAPEGLGTINEEGRFTAPSYIAVLQKITVTATSTNDHTKSASVVAILYPPLSLRVGPQEAIIDPSHTQLFTAFVLNDRYFNPNYSQVDWSIRPELGFVDGNGLYTAPSKVGGVVSVLITATSRTDPSKTSSSVITVRPSK